MQEIDDSRYAQIVLEAGLGTGDSLEIVIRNGDVDGELFDFVVVSFE